MIHGVQSVQGMKSAIDLDDVETWNAARSIAHNVMADRESWDNAMREFAAKELTELANEWRADDDEKENADPITEEAFAQRITLSELSLTYEGDFTAYFDDDDMFWGHTVEVCGSPETQKALLDKMEGYLNHTQSEEFQKEYGGWFVILRVTLDREPDERILALLSKCPAWAEGYGVKLEFEIGGKQVRIVES